MHKGLNTPREIRLIDEVAVCAVSCEACNQQFCAEHLVLLFGIKLCPACAADAWAQMPEPDCQCIQTDVDLFSVRDCPIHNPCSDWNQLRRTMT